MLLFRGWFYRSSWLGVLVSGLLLSAADLFNASDVQSSAADGLVVADGLPSS